MDGLENVCGATAQNTSKLATVLVPHWIMVGTEDHVIDAVVSDWRYDDGCHRQTVLVTSIKIPLRIACGCLLMARGCDRDNWNIVCYISLERLDVQRLRRFFFEGQTICVDIDRKTFGSPFGE